MSGPSLFRFKKFELLHGPGGLKVTTDASFFGAWIQLNGSGHVLDVGAGTGLLTLMLAQRYPDIQKFLAIEPNPTAYQLLQQNLAAARIEGLLAESHPLSFEEFAKVFSGNTPFADIVLNPPFFRNHLPGHEAGRNLALHADATLRPRWLSLAHQLASPHGLLHWMDLYAESKNLLHDAAAAGWHPIRIAHFGHRMVAKPIRICATLAKHTSPTPPLPERWYVQDPTGRYADLMELYYLQRPNTPKPGTTVG